MKKKLLIIILVIFAISLATIHIYSVKADSGWDSSYDSGGSWSSSSDWGSSSSSWDYDYSGSSGGSGDPVFGVIFIVVIFLALLIAGKVSPGNHQTNTSYDYAKSIKDESDEVLAKYGINREEFLKTVFDKYVAIQNGWMNFDYDSLKELLTDELYNTYYSQLEVLKVKEEQNIMSDYGHINSKIVEVKEENGVLSVEVYLRVQMHDYVVDKNKRVVRGNKDRIIDIEYLITFVRPLNKNEKIKCPGCGAELKDTTRGECEFCRTLIVRPSNDFVMSKKKCIRQR